jgi:hypothetical protein
VTNVPLVNPDPPASGPCDPRAPNAASKIGSGTCPRQPVVREVAGPAVRLVDREIGLGVLELLQEPVLEDVDLVHVVRSPLVAAVVAEIEGLDYRVPENLDHRRRPLRDAPSPLSVRDG